MRLAVTLFLEVAALLFVFYNINRFVAADFGDGGVYLRFGDIGRADSGVLAVIHEKHFVKDERVPHLERTGDFLNFKHISHGDFVLLAACLYDCKFHSPVILHKRLEKAS